MLAIKQGVRLAKLQPQIVLGLISLHSLWEKYGYGALTITSGSDGDHKTGSLHYSGNAVDLRIRHLHPDDLKHIVSAARAALGSDYDIVIEPDHIHFEYDPKP